MSILYHKLTLCACISDSASCSAAAAFLRPNFDRTPVCSDNTTIKHLLNIWIFLWKCLTIIQHHIFYFKREWWRIHTGVSLLCLKTPVHLRIRIGLLGEGGKHFIELYFDIQSNVWKILSRWRKEISARARERGGSPIGPDDHELT